MTSSQSVMPSSSRNDDVIVKCPDVITTSWRRHHCVNIYVEFNVCVYIVELHTAHRRGELKLLCAHPTVENGGGTFLFICQFQCAADTSAVSNYDSSKLLIIITPFVLCSSSFLELYYTKFWDLLEIMFEALSFQTSLQIHTSHKIWSFATDRLSANLMFWDPNLGHT